MPRKPSPTPISASPSHTTSGLSDGITSTCRSIQIPDMIISVNTASQNGLDLVVLFIRPKNGSTKISVNAVKASGRHGCSKRRNTHQVSSYMFAYQIGRYCDQKR